MSIVLYPEDGKRFFDGISMLRKAATTIDRIKNKDRRLGITVLFTGESKLRPVDTYSVRILGNDTFCWMGEYGERREPLSSVRMVQVWKI